MKKILFGLALIGATAGTAHATPISISSFGSTYTQNFDGLGNSPSFASPTGTNPGTILRVSNGTDAATVQGFEFAESGTSGANNGSYIFSNGTDGTAQATGDSYRYRGTSTSTDLAFGQLNTPTFGDAVVENDANPGSTFGLVFKNDTGQKIDSLTITYRGEQYRYGGGSTATNKDRIDFQFKDNATTVLGTGFSDVNDLDFVGLKTAGVGTLDGNVAGNYSNIGSTFSPTGGIAAGNTFVIRFNALNLLNNGVEVSDDALSVDDFTLTANVATPEPSTYAMFVIGMIGVAFMLRRRKLSENAARTFATAI